MSANPVTQTHLGIPPRGGWDHDGFSEVRQRAGRNEDVAPRYRAKHKKAQAITWADLDVGSQVVAAIKEWRTGYEAWFLCRVIDAYPDTSRYGDSGGRAFAVIEATNSERYDRLVGHIRGITFGYGRHYDESLCLRDVTVSGFREIPRDPIKRQASPST